MDSSYYLKGEVILSEDPLLFVNNDEPEMLKCINSQFENLSVEKKKIVSSLHDPDPNGKDDEKIFRIFKINRIQGQVE